MNLLFLTHGIILTFLAAIPSLAQGSCGASVASSVEASKPDLSLADLLEPGACPMILTAAGAIRLGTLPLAGSRRVFEGPEVRAMLQEVKRKLGESIGDFPIYAPERISVHRDSKLSCAEIAERIFSSPSSSVECGAAGRIRRAASLAVVRKHWDPATKSWAVVVRCGRPEDCVPFLVRVPGADRLPPAHAMSPSFQSLALSQANTLVRPGEAVRLTWDQNGIRAVLDAVCLDRGREGEVVRARLVRTGLTLRAVVVARGKLRAQS